VGISVCARPAHVRREREIAGHFLPDEVKSVVGKPHVGAAAGDEIFALGRIKRHRAGFEHLADIRMAGKNSEIG
jgi:hypothetical protein